MKKFFIFKFYFFEFFSFFFDLYQSLSNFYLLIFCDNFSGFDINSQYNAFFCNSIVKIKQSSREKIDIIIISIYFYFFKFVQKISFLFVFLNNFRKYYFNQISLMFYILIIIILFIFWKLIVQYLSMNKLIKNKI